MLEIRNLHVRLGDQAILKGINLSVSAGEVHAVMGPNGSGKSTLGHLLAGRDGYEIERGEILFEGADVTSLPPEERAAKGLFLGFQYPVEIPGVSNLYFLRTAVNAQRKRRGEPELDAMDFLSHAKAQAARMKIDPALLQRGVNESFSGGEKKRNEILQMILLEPKLAVLDETDSGLDIDALKVVAEGINAARGPDRAIVLITHYQRLLDYVTPDRVHVLARGSIVKSGGPELAHELEEKGYGWLDAA